MKLFVFCLVVFLAGKPSSGRIDVGRPHDPLHLGANADSEDADSAGSNSASSEEISACTQMLECEAPLEALQLSESNPQALSELDTDAKLDTFCEVGQQYLQCVHQYSDECDEKVEEYETHTGAQMIEFICSAGGRELVQRMSDSVCARNQTIILAAGEAVQVCVNNFNFAINSLQMQAIMEGKKIHPNHLCPFIAQMKTCMRTGAVEMCGEPYGEFIDEIWDIAATGVEGLDCSPRAVHAHKRMIRSLMLLR